MIISGSKDCQNFDMQFRASPTGRRFSTFHLQRELTNGTKVKRDWVVYSPSKEAIFCFACRLFGDHSINDTDSFASAGFNDWKHSSRAIKFHEHSKVHQTNYLSFRRRAKQLESIEDSFKSSVETEMDYWRDILKRIVSVVKFLGSRGLPFRGSNQIIGSNQNGNYLGILELLSEYDPLLKNHLTHYGNKGKGRASYLSANICNEFIFLIANRIENRIKGEIKKAKYFSISVDSTPDVSHADQLVFCVRYIKNAAPVERFLNFIPIEEHTSKHLTDIVINYLKKMISISWIVVANLLIMLITCLVIITVCRQEFLRLTKTLFSFPALRTHSIWLAKMPLTRILKQMHSSI